MGTVHAKQSEGGGGGGLLGLEPGGGGDGDERARASPSIRLDGVKARVDRVHVDGLERTKDDVVRLTVDELFHATDFEDVIVRAHRVRRALDSMGCFRDIGVFVDVSSGPGATPEGLEVTFRVTELSRVVGGVSTSVGENEGNLVLGVKMPNAAGRGERLQAEYSLGHRSSSNFSAVASKPFPHRPLAPALSATLYQQAHEYPTSGYRLLDRGLLLDLAFRTSPATRHNLQWEGLVRDTAVLGKTTGFRVRESSGPAMKSLVRHTVTVDRRDEAAFPTRGVFVQWTSEVCGLGGGVAHLRNEVRAERAFPLGAAAVSLGGAAGVLHDGFGTEVGDLLYLGGPTTLRGFRARGVGPHSEALAVGGRAYWALALHAWAPLPFRPGGDALSELVRSHAFVAAGSLAAADWRALADARAAAGVGVALRLGRGARLELNYCVPLRACPGDHPAPGLQFGVGAHFL